MKVIIAGGRDVKDAFNLVSLATSHCGFEITEVVSGGAKGVDEAGERWAILNDLPVKRFPADWAKNGKSAGPIRNRQMADYADALVAVWDGKSPGTENMINTAEKLMLQVYVYEIA